MGKYVVRRLLVMIPTLLFVVFIIFGILSFIPNSPGRIILGINAPEEQVVAMNQQLGYYDPMLVKFGNYVLHALQGDFGDSYKYGKPVFEVLMPKFPTTANLAFLSMLVSAVIGIPVGIIAAVKKHSLADRASTVAALLLGSIPSFFLGVLLILAFSLQLHWLPSNGLGTWKNFVMPVLTLSLPSAAFLSRLTRTTMLDAMEQDYIRTARAKGCSPMRVVFRHGLRNALMPVVTQLGMTFAGTLGGAIIIEKVFGLPGFGSMILQAMQTKDAPVIMGSTLFLSTMFMLIMLLVDIVYAFLDPRVGAKY
ncbi:MAG TPA: ABC transporter permease [Candidatus Limiplasma sp.]|jgi:peptide/nickel transport system permease protein|nr:ABC transporter permease [Candidatus Limiplasma sp.]